MLPWFDLPSEVGRGDLYNVYSPLKPQGLILFQLKQRMLSDHDLPLEVGRGDLYPLPLEAQGSPLL